MIKHSSKIEIKHVYCNDRKRKEGFTLIEMIAVIAMIGILASALLPKIGGYIKQAKKTKIVDQCRKVVMAVDSYNLTSNTPVEQTATIDDVEKVAGVEKYLDGVSLSNLDTEKTNIKKCYDIVSGGEFDIDNDEKLIN
ncbi:type II secretion system protein [Clostridium saccharoperbutylacetonicum]|uniref:type II secretion system protein n=1 Tax=Clostridium saccharoperbutylacetonicum TaxID=36745 RepID=UPI0039ECC5FC